MGWAREPSAGRLARLVNEGPARRVWPVAWLQRGNPAVDLNSDPHTGTHTAVALDRAENKLGQLRVHLAVVPA